MASNNLLVNSHYPMPWIVWKQEYSLSVSAGGYDYQQLPHGLPFTPLLIGQWSTSRNFDPSYDLEISVPGGSTGGQVETMCSVGASASSIDITLLNNATVARTFYFRLMAFAPPGYTGEVSPVEYSSPFRFNSHFRYQQLLMAGETKGPIAHNLGYLPQARIWTNYAGHVAPFAGILTTTTLSCAAEDYNYYYHIYKDILDD